MAALTCTAIPVIGMLLGHMTCELPEVAPTGRASFCAVMHRRGGKLKPSRKDTSQTVWDIEELNAAYDELKCGAAPFPKPIGTK